MKPIKLRLHTSYHTWCNCTELKTFQMNFVVIQETHKPNSSIGKSIFKAVTAVHKWIVLQKNGRGIRMLYDYLSNILVSLLQRQNSAHIRVATVHCVNILIYYFWCITTQWYIVRYNMEFKQWGKLSFERNNIFYFRSIICPLG